MEFKIILTQDQYTRYKSALTKLQGADEPVSDDALVAQMKREAAAITYAAEGGQNVPDWKF